ncbi:MAG: phosphate ABC transporter substrate-binding protein PstS [Armatimonadota bacterium]
MPGRRYQLELITIALAALPLLSGCGGPSHQSAGGQAVTLNGAGASFPYPLYSKWIAEYAKVAPGVRINYQSIGSGGGIQQLKAGTVDFGASDAPLTDDEMKAMPRPVVHLPTTAGAVAVVYNLPSLKGALRLTGPVLSAIFLGEITRWNDKRIADANPGLALPESSIAVTHRSDGSGTTYLFTSYLAAVSPDWTNKVGVAKSVSWPVGIGAKGNEGVAGMVRQTPGAIGYVELAYAEGNNLSSAQLQNRAGQFVSPTTAAITAAAAAAASAMQKDVRIGIVNSPAPGAYPISGFTHLLVYREQKDPAKGKALVSFLGWATHEGQAFCEPLSYAALPADVVRLNEAALATIQPAGAGAGK